MYVFLLCCGRLLHFGGYHVASDECLEAGIDICDVFSRWVPYVVGQRKEIVAAVDWTEFDQMEQSTTIVASATLATSSRVNT